MKHDFIIYICTLISEIKYILTLNNSIHLLEINISIVPNAQEVLLIDIFASNNSFSYRNIFQNGVDSLSKIDDAVSTKS